MEMLTGALTNPHPTLVHFPIALLIVSWVLDVASRRWPTLQPTGWIVLLLGTLATIPAVVTGLIVHEQYEGTRFMEAIERHEYFAFATSAFFIALTAWRWWKHRQGEQIGGSLPYLGLALVGLILLTLTGANGGYLVYNMGVGVEGITP